MNTLKLIQNSIYPSAVLQKSTEAWIFSPYIGIRLWMEKLLTSLDATEKMQPFISEIKRFC